ncbi:MAG TPA: serine/threonine-protein kinase [Gemmata sp.]|nr:serine/threonine-protein kinase [Gemmata sp.]
MATSTRLPKLRNPFLNALRKSGLLTNDDLIGVIAEAGIDPVKTDPIQIAALLVRKKLLTKYQAMQLLNGRTQGFVLESYKILDGIRQDRVGMVFLAEHADTRKRVALKVLPTDRASDPTILRAFMHEVRSAAKVHHPNVARVLDMGYWQGTHFVVSEFIPAPTLDRIIAAKGPMAPHAAAQVIAQAAVSLFAAHQRELIHRDVKPGNIALSADRRVILLDLGLTHMLENPWARVTKRISTKEYAEEIAHIPPEQAWGCEMDARGDVYGLGSTFYYLLTGKVPFPGLAPEMMAERQIRGVPAPSAVRPGIPREIDLLVTKMGAKDPYERYPSAREVLIAMSAWLTVDQWQGLGISQAEAQAATNARPVPPPPPPRKRGFFARLFGW